MRATKSLPVLTSSKFVKKRVFSSEGVKSYNSSAMMPSIMYHKDRTAQDSALSPRCLMSCTDLYLCTALPAVHQSVFLLSLLIVLSRSSSCFFFCKVHPYCRSERDVASKHTSQHRAISYAHIYLDRIISLVAPNHVPLLLPLHLLLYSSLRGRS